MITAAPLPDWGDLPALAGAPPSAEAAAAAWRDGFSQVHLLSRSAWSLAALVAAQRAAGAAKPLLWLPDFFCNQSAAPARAQGAEIFFYPVADTLMPDWTRCRELAESRPPDLFLLVHYFGLPNDARTAKSFCERVGAKLIEDAAHALRPIKGIGEFGDYLLYSPHKLLGLPDGALLLARDSDPALAKAVAGLGGEAPDPRPWLAKRLIQKIAPEALWRRARPLPDIPHARDPAPEPLPATPAIGDWAKILLARAGGKLAREAENRREAEAILRNRLGDLSGWAPLRREWPDGAAPYRGLFLCDTPESAETRFRRLRRSGIPAESWPDLAPELAADPKRHGAAIALRRRLICLPLPRPGAARALAERCREALA